MPSPASAASSASADTFRAPAPAVREIGRGESLKSFIDLSWTINGGDPNWVPPLREVFQGLIQREPPRWTQLAQKLVAPHVHPFHQHADVAYFIAERDGEPVGRVAAIANHRANEFHGDTIGFFGLFESVDDQAVADALLDRAAAWLKAKGLTSMQGPFNLSTNDELHSGGVLIDGFGTPAVFMMAHNPPYYQRLMEAAGMAKAKDLVAYWLGDNRPPQGLVDGIERLGRREGWRIRPLDMKRYRDEVAAVMSVYNSAWERNWGFIPMTDAEFDHMATDFKPVIDPDLVLIAETTAGEPIGFLLALPDLNQAIKHFRDGRLIPFGLPKLLWHKRKVKSLRVLTLGMKPGHQQSGLGAALYFRCFQVGAKKGYQTAEASWILEDNPRMRQAMEKVGTLYKTYRVYERPI